MRGQDSNNADISKTTYQIMGTVTEAETNGGAGTMDGTSTPNGTVLLANEVEINDKTTKTLQLNANGNWTVKVRNYNKEGKIVTINVYEATRDTIKPILEDFLVENVVYAQKGSFSVTVIGGSDGGCGLATKNDAYQYYLGSNLFAQSGSASFRYNNAVSDYPNPVVAVKDRAGNLSEHKVYKGEIKQIDFVCCYAITGLTLPEGKYKFECWGAAGGDTTGVTGHDNLTGEAGGKRRVWRKCQKPYLATLCKSWSGGKRSK